MEESHTSCSVAREDATAQLLQWQDVINKSELIAKEPIEKYQLKMIKEDLKEDGLVIRHRFGKKDPKKRNRTLLLIGEVGSGKSTLINMMVNYMLGVKWEDDIRFVVVPFEGSGRQTEAQTTAITVYEIYGQEEVTVPFSLTVIDTPGFADPRGKAKDKNIAENLYELLSSFIGVQQIDAVCLVVKGSQNCLTPNEKYIFDGILSLFGKNMEKNIMTLITFSDWVRPSEALKTVVESGVPCAKEKNNDPVHFLFNNFPLQKPEKYEKQYKEGWDNGTESFRDFFQTLDEMETQSLRMTEYVLKERQLLEASVQSLVRSEKKEETKRNELEQVQRTLKMLREDMKKNNNFKCEYMVLVKIESKATCCTVCKVNCHYPGCWWANDLRHCSVIKNNKCTKCPKKCSYEVHKKGNEIYQPQNEEIIRTCESKKEEAEDKIATAKAEISKLEQDLTAIETEEARLVEQAIQCIIQIKKLALKFDTDSTCQNILKLIEILEKNKAEKGEALRKMLLTEVCI